MASAVTAPTSGDLGALVQALLAEYPTDGTNDYWWPTDSDWAGTTRDVWYRGALVAEGDPYGRCYCVGLTWEVCMRAFLAADLASGGDGTLNGLTVADLEEFQTDWYVRQLLGAGASDALENYGIGWRVASFSDVKPGDFVQLWRNNGNGPLRDLPVPPERDAMLLGSGGPRLPARFCRARRGSISTHLNIGSETPTSIPIPLLVGRAAAPSEWIPWQ